MRKVMSVLDIGNDTTKLVVGEMVKDKLNILATGEVKTEGLSKSSIISEENLTSSIEEVFKIVNDKIGIPITKTIVIVPSKDVEFQIGEAKIKIEGEEVSGHDINKVMFESYSGSVQDNMELISCIPVSFKLDNNRVVTEPLNIPTKELAIKSVIVMAPKQRVYPILGVLENLNIDVIDISIDSIGDYYQFKDKLTNKSTGAIINIGSTKTSISIFNKGILTNLSSIDLGGKNITNDISYVYKIPKEIAEKLKIDYGMSEKELNSFDIELKNIKINQKELSQIIESRIEEILTMVKKELNYLTKRDLEYIIVTGGVTETKNFNVVLENVFGASAKIGAMNEIGARNNKYSSAIGLIKWYNDKERLKGKDYSIFSIDDQSKLSGGEKEVLSSEDSVISKVFDYFFD